MKPIHAFSWERKSGGRMRDPTTYCIRRADQGCFHFNTSHCNMLVPVEWVEQTARLVRLSSVLPLLSSRLASRSGGSSLLSPLPSAASLERWSLYPLPLQKWAWEAEKVPKPPKKKRPRKAWAPYSCPGLSQSEYFPADHHPPCYKEGKRKNEDEVHRPPCSFMAEGSCIPNSQSQRVHFSFSAEAQGEKLWSGGSTKEALPIRQVYQRNMT